MPLLNNYTLEFALKVRKNWERGAIFWPNRVAVWATAFFRVPEGKVRSRGSMLFQHFNRNFTFKRIMLRY
jgi:hypothetical protein